MAYTLDTHGMALWTGSAWVAGCGMMLDTSVDEGRASVDFSISRSAGPALRCG